MGADMADAEQETGWGPGFQLFDAPETRLLDLRAKVCASLTLVLIVAYCCQVMTVLVLRDGALGAGLGVLAVVGPTVLGPPRFHPATGVGRLIVAVLVRDVPLIVVAAVLWAAQIVGDVQTRRLHAAGHGGRPLSARDVRRERTQALKQLRRQAGNGARDDD